MGFGGRGEFRVDFLDDVVELLFIRFRAGHARLQLGGGGGHGGLRILGLADFLAGGKAILDAGLGGGHVQRQHLFHALHGLGGEGVEGHQLEFKQGLGGRCELFGIRKHVVSSV